MPDTEYFIDIHPLYEENTKVDVHVLKILVKRYRQAVADAVAIMRSADPVYTGDGDDPEAELKAYLGLLFLSLMDILDPERDENADIIPFVDEKTDIIPFVREMTEQGEKNGDFFYHSFQYMGIFLFGNVLLEVSGGLGPYLSPLLFPFGLLCSALIDSFSFFFCPSLSFPFSLCLFDSRYSHRILSRTQTCGNAYLRTAIGAS